MKPDRARRVETNLLVQQEVFERAYSTLVNGLKHVDRTFIESLKSVETDARRKKEVQNLQKSLLAIAMVIKKLKCNIKSERFVEDHDHEYFQQNLTSIEENLSSFKKLLSEQLEELQEEETVLQQSIDSLHRRLNETSTAAAKHLDNLSNNTIRQRAKSRVSLNLSGTINPDIQEFDKFLQNTGGHTGGWDANDHILFTRLLQKYRDSEQLITALLDFMPDKTPEEIAQHENWYHKYLVLKETHRKALKEWKEEQMLHKQKSDFKENDDASTYSFTSLAGKLSSKRDPLEKEKIRKWKAEQEKKRQKELEELHEKKKQEEESWRKKVAYFEHQREIIAERRKEQQKVLQNKDSQDTDCNANGPKRHIPLKDFWEQDKQYIQRRQSRLQRLSASSSRSNTRSNSTVSVERDPARLLQPTAVWRARIRRSLSEEGNRPTKIHQGQLYIADIPHLAIPKWRIGLV